MKIDEFAALVKQMRDTQRAYFASRRSQKVRQDEVARLLSESRELERRVDAAVDGVLNRKPTLFEKG